MKETTKKTQATFEFSSLTLRVDLQWRIKTTIAALLEKTSLKYDALFYFDGEQFNERIMEIKAQQASLVQTPMITDGMNKAEAKRLKGELAKAEQDLSEAEAKCPNVSFEATVESASFDETNKKTTLVLAVSEDDAVAIAKVVANVRHYKIELVAA